MSERARRLDPGSALATLREGGTLDRAAVVDFHNDFVDSEGTYRKDDLMEILMRANAEWSVPDILVSWLSSEDPFVVWAASKALFRWWGTQPSEEAVRLRLEELAAGASWDVDHLVRDHTRDLLRDLV